MNRLLTSNSAKYRLLRTIIQGIIAALITNIDLLVGVFTIPGEFKPFMVMIIMAILSPIMKELGTESIPEKEDIPHGYFEREGDADGDEE